MHSKIYFAFFSHLILKNAKKITFFIKSKLSLISSYFFTVLPDLVFFVVLFAFVDFVVLDVLV